MLLVEGLGGKTSTCQNGVSFKRGTFDWAEGEHLRHVLASYPEESIQGLCCRLDCTRATLYNKFKKHGLNPNRKGRNLNGYAKGLYRNGK